MLAKVKQVLLHIADSGRWVIQCDCWQLMHSPESSQSTVVGTGYFQQDLVVSLSLLAPSAHL